MNFNLEEIDGILVVELPGETLEATITHEFKRDITPILEARKKVVLDMSLMRFVDSSGCGALLHCLRKVEEQGGSLCLCGVSEQIESLFTVIRLNRKLAIFHKREEALKSFAS